MWAVQRFFLTVGKNLFEAALRWLRGSSPDGRVSISGRDLFAEGRGASVCPAMSCKTPSCEALGAFERRLNFGRNTRLKACLPSYRARRGVPLRRHCSCTLLQVSRLLALVVLFSVATGCAGFPVSKPHGYARTVEACGGLCSDQVCVDHAQEVLVRLLGPQNSLRVAVVESESLRAFAWPSGHLLVSCGLARGTMEADDEALAAALAHECGHLMDDGHMWQTGHRHHPATLAHGSADAEARADRLGVQLLIRAGYSAKAMDRLLVRLASDPTLKPAYQRTIRERIASLRAAEADENASEVPSLDAHLLRNHLPAANL